MGPWCHGVDGLTGRHTRKFALYLRTKQKSGEHTGKRQLSATRKRTLSRKETAKTLILDLGAPELRER